MKQTNATGKAPVKQISREAKVKSLIKGLEKEGYSTIHQIRMLARKRIKRSEAISAGFNKNTVYRQYREYLNS